MYFAPGGDRGACHPGNTLDFCDGSALAEQPWLMRSRGFIIPA